MLPEHPEARAYLILAVACLAAFVVTLIVAGRSGARLRRALRRSERHDEAGWREADRLRGRLHDAWAEVYRISKTRDALTAPPTTTVDKHYESTTAYDPELGWAGRTPASTVVIGPPVDQDVTTRILARDDGRDLT